MLLRKPFFGLLRGADYQRGAPTTCLFPADAAGRGSSRPGCFFILRLKVMFLRKLFCGALWGAE